MLMTALTPVRSPVWAEMDRLLDSALRATSSARALPRVTHPSLQLLDDGETFVLTVEVPGVRREDLKIEATEDTLSVSGSRKVGAPEGAAALRRERQDWSFSKTFRLPAPLQVDAISAELSDGMLTVRAPKKPEVLPKTIEIELS